MSVVFLDSVGLLAVWNEDDQWHRAAARAFALLNSKAHQLITTTAVLLECGNAAARRPFRADVDELRARFERAGRLIWPTTVDWREAWAAYRRGEADEAGIVDQVSFTVMRRLNVREAFTNDHHFRAAGLVTLF